MAALTTPTTQFQVAKVPRIEERDGAAAPGRDGDERGNG